MSPDNNNTKKSNTKGKTSNKTSNKVSNKTSNSKTTATQTAAAKKTRSAKSTKSTKSAAAKKKAIQQDMELWYEVGLIVLFAFMVFLFLCNFGLVGPLGVVFKNMMFGMFGFAAYMIPIILFLGIAFCWVNKRHPAVKRKVIAGSVLLLILSAIGELVAGRLGDMYEYDLFDFYQNSVRYSDGGGMFGGSLAYLLTSLFDTLGSVLVLLVGAIVCIVLITEKSFVKGVKKTGKKVAKDAVNMREYAAERSKQRETVRSEKLRIKEERIEEEEFFEEEKTQEIPEKVRGIDFRSVFAKLGEEEDEDFEIQEEFVEEIEPTVRNERKETKSNVISVEEARNRLEQKKNESVIQEPIIKQVHQISKETLVKTLPETDELHELRPKGSYHSQQRIQIFTIDEPKKQDITVVLPKEEILVQEEPLIQEVVEIVEVEEVPVKEELPKEEKVVLEETQTAEFLEPVDHTYVSQKYEKVDVIETKKEDKRPKAIMKEETVAESSMEQPYMFPPISLLQKGKSSNSRDSQKTLEETARKLKECLKMFGVNVTITDISQGPAVTRYELQPEQGVKVSKIVNLSDDIKLNLAATDIRIEAPIPGKSAIGIEVPNKENSAVAFRDLIESTEFKEFSSDLSFAVGKDIAGKIVVTDIAKMPHMLIAGSTGSGKSVCINTLIMSILYKAHPDDVKLIMVDPKVVELSCYNGIPHLLIPVVTDPKQAAAALQWGVSEMMSRYDQFSEFGVRNLKSFNAKLEEKAARGEEKLPNKLPQIVIIVDELADLMMVAAGEVEEAIIRLTQLARAAGIHLIIATQRPSVDVITGLIKANMPSRIAFAVSSGIDSRTILDMNGAEKLLGKGDMLFYPQGYSKPVRVQGSFVSDSEVGDVVDFLKNQKLGNIYREDIQSQINNMKSGSGNGSGTAKGQGNERDELFETVGRFIIEKDKASSSMLQRVFKIGFNRAARIIDQLCDYGVVGEADGTKLRKVLMTEEQFEALLEELQ